MRHRSCFKTLFVAYGLLPTFLIRFPTDCARRFFAQDDGYHFWFHTNSGDAVFFIVYLLAQAFVEFAIIEEKPK